MFYFKNIYILLLVLTISVNTYAENTCIAIFSKTKSEKAKKQEQLKQSDITSYRELSSRINEHSQNLSEKETKNLSVFLQGVIYFDYHFLTPILIKKALTGKKGLIDKAYDLFKERGRANPFEQYLLAIEITNKKKFMATKQNLIQSHKSLMAKNIDGMPKSQLGKFRNYDIIGYVDKIWALPQQQVINITKNPYLKWVNTGKNNDGSAYGEVSYLNINNLNPKVLNLIKKTKLKNTLKNVLANDITLNIKEAAQIQKQLVEHLLEERLKLFTQEKEKLGPLNNHNKIKNYIYMVASLQRDIISIHPFVDGNGRTSRFFMNSLLVSEGIFPARIMDFDLDIQGTKKQWQEEVWKGVHATHKLHVDLINRLDNGSDLTVSSLFPHLYLEDKISLPKKIKGKRNFDSKKVSAELRKGQFLAYLKQKIKKSKAFYNSILHDPVPTFRTLFVEFKEFYKNHHIKYKTENGLENLEVNLISDDFKKAFQTPVAKNKEAWQNKMKQWYSKDLIWRGLANLDYVESHSDLLNYFKNINPHMVSNRILQTGANTAKQLMNETLKDFRTYNADVISGNYVQMAMDHHMAGKLYYDSYGFSTSYKQIVGKAFAMGAMVVAEYGEHTQLKYQEQIFMRVNVAAYSSYKDLNLSRLKQINEKFSYQYPRQKEVMGIGASDPDSIMVLHIIDKNGNVEQTLARDLHNPNTVHTIDGEYVPHRDRLDHEKILRSDKLF